ncbi:MAG: hypothetical protein PHF18_01870 [Methanosarcina sp.]|uniref:hypothetical protein n=1 Tax=Methanosarcina sp. TaxID=2213 RepID=UPI002617E60D|nr:hypothetical protein [Methanosarcina sp.]MDD3245610.1 hypothetical protein [Methanosarcina sp.]
MNGFSRSDPKPPIIRAILLLFTITSFLLLTVGSLYIDMYPDNPETGEFLVNTAGPVFWFFCGIWILFNVVTILNSRR